VAQEIRLRRKHLEHANGHYKSTGGNNNPARHRGLTGKSKEEATARTRKGAKVLVLEGGRKRTFVPLWQVDEMVHKGLENLFEGPRRRR